MPSVRNERKINSLLQQMEQQTGYSVYKEKAAAEQKKQEEFSSLIKDLSVLEQQDPMRISPIANENNRQERKKEDERHRERQNIMVRVQNRQRVRGERTYS